MPRTLENPRYKKLISELNFVREKHGLTQQDVADRMEKPQSFVAKTEGFERRLDMIEFVEFCEAIGVSPSSILNKIAR